MGYNYNKAYRKSYQRRTYTNKRMNDIKKSDNMTVFLDYMYKKYNISTERVTDKCRQVSGIDVIFNNGNKNVDEKVATNYYNRDLKTYSFELYTNNNVNGTGWFEKNSHNKTTDYLLCWVRANENNDNLSKITSLECYLVNKDKLWETIRKDTGYSNSRELIQQLRKNGVCKFNPKTNVFNDEILYYQINKDYKIVQSRGLTEQPINIVISKEKLREIAAEDIFVLENNHYSIQNGVVSCDTYKVDLDEKLNSMNTPSLDSWNKNYINKNLSLDDMAL